MIPKTLALLEGIAPGTYVPPERQCFDAAEIEQLAEVLRRLLYSPSELRKKLQTLGVNVVPANFYSSVPAIEEVERAGRTESPDGPYDAIFDADLMRQWLADLSIYSAEFDAPRDLPIDEPRYRWKCQFSYSDAPAYHAFVRKLRPRTVLEVGSGFSTLIARDACEANGMGSIVCIEPFPRPFLKDMKRVTLIEKPVQEVGAEFFNDTLADGDILFIDSTHTVKHGSDCLHLYLAVLPEIRRDITVHVHDIHLPQSMPLYYARDQQIYWTEQYLLYAYLRENPRTDVLFGSTYHYIRNRPDLERFMHGHYDAGGGSLWFSHAASPRR